MNNQQNVIQFITMRSRDESVLSIARQWNMSPNELAKWNNKFRTEIGMLRIARLRDF